MQELQNWKESLLSQGAGNLAKGCGPSQPDIFYELFFSPKWCIGRIKKLITRFWWGQENSKRKLH